MLGAERAGHGQVDLAQLGLQEPELAAKRSPTPRFPRPKRPDGPGRLPAVDGQHHQDLVILAGRTGPGDEVAVALLGS